MVDFIHNNKDLYGVDAICRILPIAASTYYRTLDLCENPEHRAKRDLHDLHHAEEIKRIWKESSGRYGVRKVWQKLKRGVRTLKIKTCESERRICTHFAFYILED